MYNIEVHNSFKNGPKNKISTIFERGDYVESKYIFENEF